MKQIIVGSQNVVKIEAARIGFEKLFLGESFSTQGVSVPSGVSHQPLTDVETFHGALQRAQAVRQGAPQADYWVGIEGGLDEIDHEFHVFAWVVVLSQKQMGKAKSSTFMLPPGLASLIREGLELGDADDKFFGKINSKRDTGSVGILTDNALSRRDYYIQAVMLALIPFFKPELYR